MRVSKAQFKILLCARKELIGNVRKYLVEADEIHIQFTSSPRFLTSRAMFSPPSIVFIDASLDNGVIKDVVSEFRTQFPAIPFFMVATSANHREVVDLMSLGASGYYALPEDSRQLGEKTQQLFQEWQSTQSHKRFVELQHQAFDFSQIIGTSPQLRDILHRAKKVIANPLMTVLITGETGTGKELLARAIHFNSRNSSAPFVDIACSALPETLLESELFGFEKGAFTDAREKKQGLFEIAGDGSIFLDEIGDISMGMQSKLLKVIESRTMRRLGGIKDIPVKARIIAATSVDLDAKMKSGHFRKDLYHRLKIIPLEIPPLRNRKEDIPLLADVFIGIFNKIYDKKIAGITPEAFHVLQENPWEGNIRELKHSIERAVLLEEHEWLTGKDFDFLLSSENKNSNSGVDEKSLHTIGFPPDNEVLTLTLPMKEAAIDDVQRKLALIVLDHVGGNKSRAAYILRISRPRLDRILHNTED
jgi:DNA-binding NtrC family response regulator